MYTPTVVLTALKSYILFSDFLCKPARKLYFISLSWFQVIVWIFVATVSHRFLVVSQISTEKDL